MYRPPEMCDLTAKYLVNEKVDIWMLGNFYIYLNNNYKHYIYIISNFFFFKLKRMRFIYSLFFRTPFC